MKGIVVAPPGEGRGGTLAREIAKKFPRTPTLTLAKILYREHPAVYTTLDAARSAVRRVRGAQGNRSRRKVKDKSLFRGPGEAGDVFGPLPASEPDDWEPFRISERRLGIIGDTHIPFHHAGALRLALEHLYDAEIDALLLNGDIVDFHQISRWVKDPEQRRFADEIAMLHEFFASLRRAWPELPIYFREGNHEERYIHYMRIKAPELIGVEAFTLPNVLDLERHSIQYVDGRRKVAVGKLLVFHGHEFGRTMTNPVNPARGLFLRSKTTALCGHYHQTSEHAEKDAHDTVVGCWSIGALCGLHPEWLRHNKWNHGFAVVEQIDAEGRFHVFNHKILKGRVY